MEPELAQRLTALDDALALLRFPLPPPLLSTSTVAKLVGIGEATVRRWIVAGDLPAVRFDIGSRAYYRVRQTDLDAFLEARKTGRPIANEKAPERTGGFLDIPDIEL